MAAILVSFLLYGEYTTKTHVVGYLAPNKGIVRVLSPQSGVLKEIRIREGSRVSEGAPLLAISAERDSLETPKAQSQVLSQLHQRRHSLEIELQKQGEVDAVQAAALRDKFKILKDELVYARHELLLQEERVKISSGSLDRFQKLLNQGFVPEAQLQQKREEHLDQRAKLQALERAFLTLQRELRSVDAELAASALRADNNRSAIERSISELTQQITDIEVRRVLVINAPVTGTVSTVLVDEGASVSSGTLLMSILPEGSTIEAHLFVPSKSVGFVRVGQQVGLRYDAFPYQRFGSQPGTLRQISNSTLAPVDTGLPNKIKEPSYRAIVRLERATLSAYGKELPLQAGMMVEADIALDRRRLIEWMFEPLFSVTGRL
jgi:membrane fusion protein